MYKKVLNIIMNEQYFFVLYNLYINKREIDMKKCYLRTCKKCKKKKQTKTEGGNKKMKKNITVAMAMVLTTGILNSPAVYAEDSSLSGTITLACNEANAECWNRIIERFHEKYPDIDVEISTFTDYTALNQNVMAAHQAGSDFDLTEVNHVDTLSFIKGELLEPLSDRLQSDGIDLDSIIMGNLEDMGKLGDVAYTFPIDTDTRIMLVNTDLFDKYGLEIPKTMDDMLEAGKVISEKDEGDYVFTDEMCTNGDYFSTYETGIFLQSCGGQLYTVDENGKATATIDTDGMREYLTFITELLQYMPEDCITNNDARSAFCEGNIGMYTFGPWEYQSMDMDSLGFNYTLIKVPEGPAGSVSTSGGFQLGIGAGSEKKDLSYALMEFVLTDGESMAIIGESGLPTVESAYENGTFSDSKYDVFLEQLQSSNLPQVPVANLGEVVACFTGYWNDLCIGNITVDEMIEEAQPAVQALLDENN